MAGKRAITPAMREHLRIIGQKGGKTTATRWGGWAAPHAARKARGRKAPSNVPSTSMRRPRAVHAPAKVTDVSRASTIAQARILGLPPSAFGRGKGAGTTNLKVKPNGFARISSRKTTTRKSRTRKVTTRGY